MDQLRKFLTWLKEQHFWVLSALVAIVAVGCWFSGAGTLQEEFTANQAAITAEFTAQDSLRNKPFHPNQEINAEQLQEIQKQAENVATTWRALYERQRERELVWPDELPQEFRDYVEDRQFGDPLPRSLLDHYMDYVGRHFEELPKKVNARIMPETQGGYGGVRGMSDDGGRFGGRDDGYSGDANSLDLLQHDDHLVEWLDQYFVRAELNFQQRPSPLKVWVTQENLWVYHTLLQVVANTNEAKGSDRPSNAAVRDIISLEVGRAAAQFSRATGRILMDAPVVDPSMMTDDGRAVGDGGVDQFAFGLDGESGGFGRGDGGATGRLTPEQERTMLLSARYLDAEGKPIPATGESTGAREFGVEYKRLPIRMTLHMDQRWLTHLIAECASQPLQVEVTEVRVNPPDLGAGGDRGGSRGFGGGFGGGGRGFDGGSGSLFPSRVGQVQAFPQQPHMATIVIQGIIFIFNPPDPTVLQPDGQVAGI